MKRFLAIYLGSREALEAFRTMPEAERKAKEQEGMKDWMNWAEKYKDSIIYDGSPLGKTKQVDKDGVSDTRNDLGAFTVIQAEDHDSAAKMFINHPHFMIFPGDRVEVIEQIAIPSRQ